MMGDGFQPAASRPDWPEGLRLNVVDARPGAAEATARTQAPAKIATETVGEFWIRQLGRMRFQLAAGLLFGVVAPAIIRTYVDSSPDPKVQVDNSFLGTLWAMLVGYLIFRKVTAFPGVRATAYIIPTLMASYVMVPLIFTAVRLDFSRYQFVSSWLLSTITFYVMFFIAARARRQELAIIPGGNVTHLADITWVKWRLLTSPDEVSALSTKMPIVADLRGDLDPPWERCIADSALAGRPVYNSKQIHESLSGRVQVEHLSENPFGALTPNTIYASVKHQCDWLLAAAALVVLGPALLLVALAIRLDAPGPALFRQARMGQGGRQFTVYKFRTMVQGAAAQADVSEQMTCEGDPRITRVGKILRKTRIDELPQIINILRNEMSWIGPRPEAIMLSRWYEAQIPFYRYRHIVRPGITGWAQVNQGHVTNLEDVDVKLQYDFFYVKNFSLWLDIMVLLRTLRVMLTGHGAK